jgi:hypothetical protein
VRISVGSWGVRFALRKAVRRFVRRRGGVGWEMDMAIEELSGADKRYAESSSSKTVNDIVVVQKSTVKRIRFV